MKGNRNNLPCSYDVSGIELHEATELKKGDPTHSNSFGPKNASQVQLKDFRCYLMYFGLLGLFIAYSIAIRLEVEFSNRILGIALLIQVGTLLLSIVIFIVERKLEEESCLKSWMLGALYGFTGVSMILSNLKLLGQFTEEEIPYSVAPGFWIFPLMALGPQFMTKTLQQYLFFSLVIMSFHCGLSFNDYHSIFEFLLLLVFFVFSTVHFPKKHTEVNPYFEFSENSVVGQNSLNTGLEEVVYLIKSCKEILLDLPVDGPFAESLCQANLKLSKAIRFLQRTNIYSADFERITRNLDESDRIFLDQYCFGEHLSGSSSVEPQYKTVEKKELYSYGMEDLIGLLKQVGKEWNFNTFMINDCSGSVPIQICGRFVVKKYGLNEVFSISDQTLVLFLQELENKYQKNPYHNSCHATDVMCSYLYLVHNSIIESELNSLELFAGIMASLAHDVGHPAKNNRFLVLSHDEVAIRYNDISVLEMMHCTIFFEILKDSPKNILANVPREKWVTFRKLLIEMILATDMGKHFELLGFFNTKYIIDSSVPDLKNFDSRMDLYRMVIKAADIGHAAKSKDLHVRWCGLVIQEFFNQGDLEKSLGLSVSMYCDRDTTDIPKSQAGFISNIVLPLFQSINHVVKSEFIEEKCLRQLKNNLDYWESSRTKKRNSTVVGNKNTLSLEQEKIDCALKRHNSIRKASHPVKLSNE